MKRVFANTAGVLLLAALLCPARGALAAPGDVQTSLDAPCKYPAGLATDGERLFLLDWRDARIHALDPADGSVTQSWDAPTLKPHGLTFGNGRLYVSDDHTGRVYVLNLDNGMVEDAFEAPGSRAVGLAYADGALFILEKSSGKIYKVLPEDGTILGYFDVPDRSCTCMAFDGRYLWIANRIEDELYMVDPADGTVLGIIEAPGPFAAGLAWLDDHLWNVDFQTRKIYQLVIHDEKMFRLFDQRDARVEYLWALSNYGPGEVRGLVVNIAVPEELVNQQLLSDVRFSTPPARMASDQWKQSCAVFELGTVPAGSKTILSYSVDARVWAVRYLIIPERTGTLDDIPPAVREAYTADGSRYRIETPFIRQTAKDIVGDETNCYRIARKIYNHLIDRLHYEMVGGWDVPEVVLKRGSGSCSEYTFCFVALCRAAGLPARYQGSVVVRGDDASIDEAFHRWAQVYLPNYGWVPVDANRGDAESAVDQAHGFGELSNRFLITTQNGGDSEYLGWGYNSFAQYKTAGYCKVEEDNFGFWEPLESVEAESSDQPAAAAAAQCQP